MEVPADMVINCADPVPAPSYLSYDDCSWNEVIFKEKRTNHNDCEYTLVRIWTATDGCGNSVQKSQTIKVIDPDAPIIEIVNPTLKDLALGGSMDVFSCESPRTFISDIEVHDCCAAISVEAYDQLLSVGHCAEDGFLQKWRCGYIVTDGAGNESEFYFFVFLRDTTSPVLFNIPKDTILPCDVALPEFDSSSVHATDNCELQKQPHFTEVYYNDPIDSSEFALRRRWTIGDACGNMTEAYQWIFTCGFDSATLINFDTSVVDSDTSTIEQDSSTMSQDSSEMNRDTTSSDSDTLVVDTDSVSIEPQDSTIGGTLPATVGQTSIAETGINGSTAVTFQVFPNPAENRITVDLIVTEPDNLHLILVNKLGQVLEERRADYESGRYMHTLDLSKYSNGIYSIVVVSKNGTVGRSVVKLE
ncbi:MAG: T9SS type A sorting domain-containing protein [Saprospiraceae bacterium]|nr:T9SS type A sorting domain-containing protein [Saprospiraceae bacterium]